LPLRLAYNGWLIPH